MAKLQRRSLSNRVVDRLSVEGKDVIYWDRDLSGFGVRVYRSGARVYLVQGRGPGGSKRIAVGRHGVISADEARRRGAMLLTRIKAGEELEPRSGTAAGPTVGELAERYLREHVAVRCKPNTARGYRRVIAKYILPTLGKLPAAALGREHCRRPAPPSTHDARHGERGGRRSVAHFQSGGSVGAGPGGWQPLPLRDQVQVAPA